MERYVMLTAFGQDRPGIVAALAEGLYQLGCNIEDTCMTRLRGEFSMMVLVRLPASLAPDHLSDRLALQTRSLGLTLLCREVPPEAVTHSPESQAPSVMLSVYGADRPGIVAQVARAVADQGGNITDMNTRVIGSSERPVYVMVLEVLLPVECRPEAFQEALDRLKPTLGVDITVRPIESVRL